MRTIILENKPLISIIFSALEVYKNECIGILLGNIYRKNEQMFFRITNYFSIQKAKRKIRGVEFKNYLLDEARKIAEQNNLQILGDLHSHTDAYNYLLTGLSEDDKNDLINNIQKEISGLVLVKKVKKKGKPILKEKELVWYSSFKKQKENIYKLVFKFYYHEGKLIKLAPINLAKDLRERIKKEKVSLENLLIA